MIGTLQVDVLLSVRFRLALVPFPGVCCEKSERILKFLDHRSLRKRISCGRRIASGPNEDFVPISNRRSFIWTVAAIGAVSSAAATKENETVYRFSTPECEGRMSIQFLDKYASRGFWFKQQERNRRFCLSGDGHENQACLPDFSGSMAIAVYHFRPRPHSPAALKIREHVRTIDQDSRMNVRPPFDANLPLQSGIASDIQAFGYTAKDDQQTTPNLKQLDPWCLLRQDLYLDDQTAPFLIVHWKHTLRAITLIDVIPGDRTEVTKL
jgi:hypothetical protein